jgi:hypothetical protein
MALPGISKPIYHSQLCIFIRKCDLAKSIPKEFLVVIILAKD